VRLQLSKAGETIGYIMGPGDDVPAALAEAGYRVTLIEDADLAAGDLSRYNAIVTGVRAYNAREALKRNSKRLLDYVESGGTLVVQYNTSDQTLRRDFAPFPLEIGRDRVTVEEAPVVRAVGPGADQEPVRHPVRVEHGEELRGRAGLARIRLVDGGRIVGIPSAAEDVGVAVGGARHQARATGSPAVGQGTDVVDRASRGVIERVSGTASPAGAGLSRVRDRAISRRGAVVGDPTLQ